MTVSPTRSCWAHPADRRFNRTRYDADKTIAVFAAGLQGAVDLDTVRGNLAGVVQQALEPVRISIWMSKRR